MLYGGDPVVWIDVLGYEKFANRVLTCKKVIQIHTLPPTAETAAHQSLRAFFSNPNMDRSRRDRSLWLWVVNSQWKTYAY